MAYDDSKCPKNFLCDFQLSRDLPDAIIEVCGQCGKKVVYHKGAKGRTDNKKYLRDHIRATVQPFGKTQNLFKKIYGNKVLDDFLVRAKRKKSKKQIEAEWELMRRDLRK